ncbi:MAG: PTS sugar transporter subunit IIA [Spirochaetota bacterium]
MQKLLDLLDEANVIYDLQASTVDSIITEMVDTCVATGTLAEKNREKLIASLIQREKSMSTGIGGGIAIPHCSVDYLESSLTLLAISKQGLDFKAIDDNPVHIFVMLVVPKNKFQDHIKTLALIAKTLGHEDENQELIQATTFAEVQTALQERQ